MMGYNRLNISTIHRQDIFSLNKFCAVNLFKTAVLLSPSRIDPHSIPEGLFYYEIGLDNKGNAIFGERVSEFVFGVVSSKQFPLRRKKQSREIGDTWRQEYTPSSLQEYCKETGVELTTPKFSLVAPRRDEFLLFYPFSYPTPATEARIGHVCLDFGFKGREFRHIWNEQAGNEELNDLEFQDDLDEVARRLRRFVLKDLPSMKSYCYSNGTLLQGMPLEDVREEEYGFAIKTEKYLYYLRCDLRQGEYNGYLNCFRMDLMPEF